MKRHLELESAPAGEVLVVTVKGEVDMESSPRLLAELQRGLKRAASVAVDLADVGYIDSSGLAVLVQALRAAKLGQRRFVLRRPSRKVMAVLELADLQDLFAVETDPTGA